MARGKKIKTGGKSRGTPRSGRQNKSFIRSSEDFGSDSGLESKTFTLRDAARNSEHHGHWSASKTQLRHQTMKFVASSEPPTPKTPDVGTEEPENPEKPNSKSAEESTPAAESSPIGADEGGQHAATAQRSIEQAQFEATVTVAEATPARVSTHDTEAVPEGTDATASSEDEVVFGGRNVSRAGDPSLMSRPGARRGSGPRPEPASTPSTTARQERDVFDPSKDFVSLNIEARPASSMKRKALEPRSNRKRSRAYEISNETKGAGIAAALDDYLSNVQQTGELDMDVDHPGADAGDADMNGWATEDMQDFDNLSTSEEVLETVAMVLSKRQRASGLQYLVVWEEQAVDEARWILHSSLPASAGSLIDAFEEEEKNVREYQEGDLESESDEDDGDDDEEEDDDEEGTFAIDWGSDEDLDESGALDDDDINDERDLIQRRMDRMTDEHIARLLQKQESLGILDDELALFDGVEDIGLPDELVGIKSAKSAKRKNSKFSKTRQKPTFFSEEDEELFKLHGDDYGSFDPMDRELYDLAQPGRRGKRAGPSDFELSDSDMADQLRSAWETDRRKKKAKKAEREELRAQGLLGKSKNKQGLPDLRARYTDGFSMQSLEQELEDFMFNEQASQLSLPPLDKRDRKIIHDIANGFGLKSKSQGSGKKRFPMLFKTSRTIDFDDAIFEKMKSQLNRRFFSRMDAKGKGKGPVSRKGGPGRGFGGKTSIGYRDGEVVGAGASEIGIDNRGRAMLEKMGWSKGTALGAMGSQGILMPIEHIVKNSKAGLG